jgi:hypothetical protein
MSGDLDSDDFHIAAYLQTLTKRHHYRVEGEEELEIDFIALEKKLAEAQGVQQRTCEQIVEFVDQHRERFLAINENLGSIEEKVRRSENLLKVMASRIGDYKAEYYLTESKIQRFISDYELALIRDQLLGLARREAAFLLKFNAHFEGITNRGVSELHLTQKYLVARFTFKLSFLRALYEHHIVKEHLPHSLEIGEVVTNLADELEFYLGEQLAKYQALLPKAEEQAKAGAALEQIRGWFANLGKQEEYFKIIERITLEKEMQAGEKLLLSNKTTLLSGKDAQTMEAVFAKIFRSAAGFPASHPKDRLKGLMFAFFKKEELKFLYTYAMPIFPLAYKAYFAALEGSGMPGWLSQELQERHGWNLKMWVHVREKNISDRSTNDTDMLKWVDIVFKNACLLPGTLPDFTRLMLKIVNRYLAKAVSQEFLASSFNKLVEQSKSLGPVLREKIVAANPRAKSVGVKVEGNLEREFKEATEAILSKNLQNIAHSCQGSL